MSTEAVRLKHAEYMRLYRKAHPDQFRLRNKLYRESHRGEALAYGTTYRHAHREDMKAYYLAHRDELIAKKRVKYKERREAILEYAAHYRTTHQEQLKAYRANHKELSQKHVLMRRTRKRNLPATLTVAQWRAIVKAYDGRCAYCGAKGIRLSQDHVVPLLKGGGYTPDNIVPACIPCNSAKGARAPSKIPGKRLLI